MKEEGSCSPPAPMAVHVLFTGGKYLRKPHRSLGIQQTIIKLSLFSYIFRDLFTDATISHTYRLLFLPKEVSCRPGGAHGNAKAEDSLMLYCSPFYSHTGSCKMDSSNIGIFSIYFSIAESLQKPMQNRSKSWPESPQWN